MGLVVVILAAGNGTRMQSKTPKVLHTVASKPMICHTIDTVKSIDADRLILVYGHKGDVLQEALSHYDITWVHQSERLGTGHAVQQAAEHIQPEDKVLILYGDVPLISSETLAHLVEATGQDNLGLLTATLENPKGLGRILRDDFGQVTGIVEEKDATDLQRQIKEINTGIYVLSGSHLKAWLPQIQNDNAQQEYYLTDIVGLARADHVGIAVSEPKDVMEIQGANNRVELARLEAIFRQKRAEALMLAGATIIDPTRLDIRGNVTVERDCVIDVNVVLEGDVTLGEDAFVGPNTLLRNVTVGKGVYIEANTIIENAVIHDNVRVGPFARIRPETTLKSNSRVGNFVEIKKSVIGQGSKVNHLSYIGDAHIGDGVNVGAGVITCNYDGANKHQTTVEDNAFVGSGSQLVAPVTVGEGGFVGAGSTITKDTPPESLALTRAPQKHIDNWPRPQKQQKAEAAETAE